MKNYGANLSEQNLKKSFKILEQVYQEVPKTKGCEKANSKNGCGAYCCRLQSPSMYLCEFLYLWEHFTKHSTKDQFLDVVLAAVKNYLKSTVTKGCVFFDEKKNKCLQHKERPLYCRLYAIINNKSWIKKTKVFKQQHINTPHKDKKDLPAILKQCDLVKTADGRKSISEKQENEWFGQVKDAERALGISELVIIQHDHQGGSYRAMHDHILLSIFNDEFMALLYQQRILRHSEEVIEKFAEMMRDKIEY